MALSSLIHLVHASSNVSLFNITINGNRECGIQRIKISGLCIEPLYVFDEITRLLLQLIHMATFSIFRVLSLRVRDVSIIMCLSRSVELCMIVYFRKGGINDLCRLKTKQNKTTPPKQTNKKQRNKGGTNILSIEQKKGLHSGQKSHISGYRS